MLTQRQEIELDADAKRYATSMDADEAYGIGPDTKHERHLMVRAFRAGWMRRHLAGDTSAAKVAV